MKKEFIKRLEERYPKGTRIKLLKMEDEQAPPIGTMGTVYGIDAIGSILVKWDNGSSLNVLYNIDKVEKIKVLTDEIKKQILIIRDTGLTNMFDIYEVQRIANEMNFNELVIFLLEHQKEYANFILTGKE